MTKFTNYNNFIKVLYKITTKSPFLIKSSETELSPSTKDSRMLKNAKNVPVIPGSTMKGFFRGNLERISHILNISDFGRLFGNNNEGSCIYFSELEPDDLKTIKYESRSQIAIDRKTLSTKSGALLFLECLSSDVVFKGSILLRNAGLKALAYIYFIILMANEEMIRLGFNKSRGYGIIEIKPTSIEFNCIDLNKFLFKISPSLNDKVTITIEDKLDNEPLSVNIEVNMNTKSEKDQIILKSLIISDEKGNEVLNLMQKIYDTVIKRK